MHGTYPIAYACLLDSKLLKENNECIYTHLLT